MTNVDLTALVNAIQQGNALLTAIHNDLKSGVAAYPYSPVYTVAGLPSTGSSGQFAFASNGRKPGEGAGSGTGVPVFFNSATGTWFSYCSGTVVAS